MTNDQSMEILFGKRSILIDLYNSDNPLVVIVRADGTLLDTKHKKYIIDELVTDGLIILTDSTTIANNMEVQTYINTELGNLLYEFDTMHEFFKEKETQEDLDLSILNDFEFNSTGNRIKKTIRKYDPDEIKCLMDLLSVEEQDVYMYFLNTLAAFERKGNEIQPVLKSMFDMSVVLGKKDTSPTRTNNYVFKKCMEELGEMALEDQIESGFSYKCAGADGVKGEAVDLAICAMDMFALQCTNKSAEEIEKEFLEYMSMKLTKWRNTLQGF